MQLYRALHFEFESAYAKKALGWSIEFDSIKNRFTIEKKLKYKNSIYHSTNNIWGVIPSGKKRGYRGKKDIHDASKDDWDKIIEFIEDGLPKIIYFPSFIFEIPERILINPGDIPGYKEGVINRFYREVIQDILSSMDGGFDIDVHIIERMKSGGGPASEKAKKRALSQLLVQMGGFVTKEVIESWDEIFARQKSRKKVYFDIYPAGDGSGGIYMEIQIEEGGAVYSISERSLGFRWFFSFFLFTKFRVYRREKSKALFLFDEPASNLHSAAQAKLLEVFDKVCASGSSIIYSTHSSYMIDPRRLEDAYVVQNECFDVDGQIVSDGLSSNTLVSAVKYKRFVNSNPSKETYFRPVLDALDYRPPRLDPLVGGVNVILEGKSDFYAFRYFVSGHDKLRFFPSVGSSGLDYLISIFLGWGSTFLVLLDADAEGIKQKERYIGEWGLSNKVVLTYADIDSRFLGFRVEDLISDSDKEKIREVLGGAALDKKVLARFIRENHISESPFMFGDETLSNFLLIEQGILGLFSKPQR